MGGDFFLSEMNFLKGLLDDDLEPAYGFRTMNAVDRDRQAAESGCMACRAAKPSPPMSDGQSERDPGCAPGYEPLPSGGASASSRDAFSPQGPVDEGRASGVFCRNQYLDRRWPRLRCAACKLIWPKVTTTQTSGGESTKGCRTRGRIPPPTLQRVALAVTGRDSSMICDVARGWGDLRRASRSGAAFGCGLAMVVLTT